MSTRQFSDWLIHRCGVLRLEWPGGMADAAGVSSRLLDELACRGNLAGIGRSARAYVARAMKISLRELEALAAGHIAWIDDSRCVDLDSLAAVSSSRPRPPIPESIACSMDCGVPIVGRIRASGIVELFDAWKLEEGSRIAIRYPGLADAFALEVDCDVEPICENRVLIFHPLPPGEIQRGDRLLFTYGQGEIITEYACDAGRTSLTVVVGSKEVALENIHRAARVVGSFER